MFSEQFTDGHDASVPANASVDTMRGPFAILDEGLQAKLEQDRQLINLVLNSMTLEALKELVRGIEEIANPGRPLPKRRPRHRPCER